MSSTTNGVYGKANPKRPSVLHLGKYYPPHMGGIETHLQVLCGELQKSLDVQVVVANETDSELNETVDGVSVCRVPNWMTFASSPLCPAMISKLRAYRGNLLHLHLPNPVAALAYLASNYRGPVVITYHSDLVRQKILGPAFEPFLHAVLRRSGAIITTSPNYLKTSSVLFRHQERCRVIPLGIRIEDFEHCDREAVSAVRERYGDQIVVSVGRLVYYKGFEHLVRAMTCVPGHLLIVGKGPLRESLTTLAGTLGVADRVHFLGNLDHKDLVACYHAARVFVLPSIARSEAFGIAQVEAMAAGLPVVNTNLDSGVPFVSPHGQTGLTVPPADPEALAAAIATLLRDPELSRSLGAAARLRARKEFALETMVSRTLSVYEDLIRGPRKTFSDPPVEPAASTSN